MKKLLRRQNSFIIMNGLYLITLIALILMDYLIYGHYFFFGSMEWTVGIIFVPFILFGVGMNHSTKETYIILLLVSSWMITLMSTLIPLYLGREVFMPLWLMLLYETLLLSDDSFFFSRGLTLYLSIIAAMTIIWSVDGIFVLEHVLLLSIIVAITMVNREVDKDIWGKVHEVIKENENLLHYSSEAFALHEMVFDKHGDPVDYKFLKVNKAFENMTGLESKQILGKTVKEIIPDIDEDWIRFYTDVVIRQNEGKYLDYISTFDKYFEANAYPVNQKKFAVLFLDVTDRVKKDMEVRQALKIEGKANRMKTRFLRDVNHRLRTPLNGMMGMIQLIDRDTMDEENRELYDAILVEMEHSRNIINQISKFVELEDLEIKVEEVNILEIIRNEVESFEDDALDYQLDISEREFEKPFHLEKSIFSSVLREIIMNAINYTREHKINIKAELKKDYQERDVVEVAVKDFGNGIDPDRLEYIFNEFNHHDFINIYREDNRISIPLCKQMLMLCQGDLKVESELGKGATFTIVLPIYVSPHCS